ncbi:MAG: effector binding domain-containing protein [Candidatus Lokiarchaeota archaeon]|nr:effector binding domain-containing protein [Candidatus Lokiarchaeota archaeon]
MVGANVNGKPNYLAVGAISVVHNHPTVMMVSLTKTHYTSKGIIENETFSINIPSVSQVIETDYCGIATGKTTDKSEIFTTFYGELESAPMIEECPITCECKLIDSTKVKYCIAFFGEVCQLYSNDQNFDISHINPMLLSLGEYRSITQSESLGRCYKIGWNYEGARRKGIKPKFLEKEEFQVVGVEDVGKEINRNHREFWIKLRDLGEKVQNRDASHTLEIHMYTKELSEKGENRFILGNELSKVENIPEGLVHITIPTQKYAMFTQIGNYDNFMATVQYVFGEWFPDNKKYERVPLAPDFVWYDARYNPRSDKSEFDWYIPIQEKSSSI